MKKYSLDISSDDEFDFDIIGISCLQGHYKVIYDINTLLNIDLVLESYLEYTHKEGQEFLFPLYQYTDEALSIEYNLIPNATSYQPPKAHAPKGAAPDLFGGKVEASTYLLPELENTNYFFILKGQNRFQYYHRVFEQLKKSATFSTIQEIFVDDIKDKKARGNLLF